MRLWGDAIGLGYLKNDQIWQSLQVWPIFLFVFSDHATELRIAQEKNAECQNTISTIKTEVPFLKKNLLNILIFWISLLWNLSFQLIKKKKETYPGTCKVIAMTFHLAGWFMGRHWIELSLHYIAFIKLHL